MCSKRDRESEREGEREREKCVCVCVSKGERESLERVWVAFHQKTRGSTVKSNGFEREQK